MRATYFYLENQQDTHNKFYLTAAGDDGYVLLNYGKIGTRGQRKFYDSEGGRQRAMDEIIRKVDSKDRGGYDIIHRSVTLDVTAGDSDSWIDAWWWAHQDGAGKALEPLVNCGTCGTGGFDLTDWRVVDGKLTCYGCIHDLSMAAMENA